jgi:hypothetical protein
MYVHFQKKSPAKTRERSGPVYQRAGKLRLNRHVAVHQTLAHHFEVTVSMLQNFHFNPELISRYYRLTKPAFIDSREIDQFGISALIAAAKQQDNANLGERFDQKHSRHYRVIREMALKKRLIDCDILEPDHVSQTVSLEDSIYKQERVTLRQDLEDVLNLLNRKAAFNHLF